MCNSQSKQESRSSKKEGRVSSKQHKAPHVSFTNTSSCVLLLLRAVLPTRNTYYMGEEKGAIASSFSPRFFTSSINEKPFSPLIVC